MEQHAAGPKSTSKKQTSVLSGSLPPQGRVAARQTAAASQVPMLNLMMPMPSPLQGPRLDTPQQPNAPNNAARHHSNPSFKQQTSDAVLHSLATSTISDLGCKQRYVRSQQNSLLEAHMTEHLHMRRLDLSHGAAYKPTPIVARHSWSAPVADRGVSTHHMCLMLNFRPSVWQEADDEPSTSAMLPHGGTASQATLGKIYGWHSPRMLPGDAIRGLEELSKTYEAQFSTLVSPKKQPCMYHCVNARPEELTNSLRALRQDAGPTGRLLFYYNGHGVSRPRGNYFNLGSTNSSGDNVKYTLDALRANAQYPMVVVADCPSAGTMLNNFIEAHRREDEQSMQHYRSSGGGVGVGGGAPPGGPPSAMPGASSGFHRASTSAMDLEGSSCASGGNDGSYPRSARGGALYTSPNDRGSPVAQNNQGFAGLTSPIGASAVPLRDDFFFVGSCADGDALPSHAMLPNDLLTSCLTTPVTVALLWFAISTRALADVHPFLIHLLPGALEDKKSPLGQLKWAFDSYTETIAWSTIESPEMFNKLFRQDYLLSGVFRGYLLAQRIVSQLNGHVVVYPPMPDTHTHAMWDSFDLQVERAVTAMGRALRPVPMVPRISAKGFTYNAFREYLDRTTSRIALSDFTGKAAMEAADVVVSQHFLTEELATVSSTLDCYIEQGFYRFTTGGGYEKLPSVKRLPMLDHSFRVLSHREEAMRLLCRFIDLGAPALAQIVELNFFSEILKILWKHPKSLGHRTALMFVYAKAVFHDPAVLTDDVRGVVVPILLNHIMHPVSVNDMASNTAQAWQLNTLQQFALPAGQVALGASLIAMISARSPHMQQQCIECGALDVCCALLKDRCMPVSPALGPKGGMSPGHNPLGGSSPLVSAIQTTDVEVIMRLSLLAMFCSLVFNCAVGDPAAADDDGGEQTKGKEGAAGISVLELGRMIRGCIPSFRSLLCHAYPSVRLAATRAIAVLLSHPMLSAMEETIPPGSPPPPQQRATDDGPMATANTSTSSSAAATMREDDPRPAFITPLFMLILERCEVAFPFECNMDVRLEQLALLHSMLLRHGKRTLAGLSSDALHRYMGPRMPPAQYHGIPAARASHHQHHHRGASSVSILPGGTTPLVMSQLMSPFSLPPQTIVPAASVSGEGDAARAEDSDEDSPFKDFGTTPLPTSHLTLPTPQIGHRRAAPHSMSHVGRIPRALPRSQYLACTSAARGVLFAGANGTPPVHSDAAIALCLALRFLTSCRSDACPTIRAHAETSIDALVTEGGIPMRREHPSSVAARQPQAERTGTTSESTKQGFWFFSLPRRKEPAERAETKNVRNTNATTPPVMATGGLRMYHGGDVAADDEESTTLRVVDHRSASTVHPLIYSIVAYLGEVCLVPLDDHDPRNATVASSRATTEEFSSSVGRIIQSGCQPTHYSMAKDFRFVAVSAEREIGDVPRAIALHPTEKVYVVASHTDAIQIMHYDEQRGTLASFYTSSVMRSCRETCRPFSAPSIPNPFAHRQGGGPLGGNASGRVPNGSSGGFTDTVSEVDSQLDPSTPHGGGQAALHSSSVPVSTATTNYSSSTGSAATVVDVMFIDSARMCPIVAAVHQNGSVGLFSINLAAMLTSSSGTTAGAGATNQRGSQRHVASLPEDPNVLRISSFQTMAQEHRVQSLQCVAAYHSVAQHLHVTSPDGAITTWDLAVEQLVGIYGGWYGSDTFGSGSSTSTLSFQQQMIGPSALVGHPLDPFRFMTGSHHMALYDTRAASARPILYLEPPQRLHSSNHQQASMHRMLCLHAGFSLRYDHMLTGAFSTDSVVVAWDERFPVRPLFFDQPPLEVHHAASMSHPMSASASHMAVHALHPSVASISVIGETLCYGEFVTGLRARQKLKHPATCCAFHPLATVCAVGTTGGKVSLLEPRVHSTNFAHEILWM